MTHTASSDLTGARSNDLTSARSSDFSRSPSNGDTLIDVTNLKKYFPVRSGVLRRVSAQVKAVDGVSFRIKRGECLGLVGESGCGKTTIGRSILRLVEPTEGSVHFDGVDVIAADGRALKALRKEMQIIFQDPYSSLDPRIPIGESISEGLLIHGMRDSKDRYAAVLDMLRRVGLEEYHCRRYPHEFSGARLRSGQVYDFQFTIE